MILEFTYRGRFQLLIDSNLYVNTSTDTLNVANVKKRLSYIVNTLTNYYFEEMKFHTLLTCKRDIPYNYSPLLLIVL